MKLSQQAVDEILHVIETFDRERGIPHDYHDLEVVLLNTSFLVGSDGKLGINHEKIAARIDTPLDDAPEAKEMLLRAAREWLE